MYLINENFQANIIICISLSACYSSPMVLNGPP
jgi:hypothetical protein